MSKNGATPGIRLFEAGQSVTGFFVVRKKELRIKKDGDPYLFLELGDRTGRIPAAVWEKPESVDHRIRTGSLIKARGKTVLFQDRLHLTLDRVRPVRESDAVSPDDFLPHGEADTRTLWKELDGLIASVREACLQDLLAGLFGDPAFRKRFGQAPGGKLWHHACMGGLLAHTLGVAVLCERIVRDRTEIDRDLLVTAALLHDIGKVESYRMDGFIDYSDLGRLWGHIVIGAQHIWNRIGQMRGKTPFPEELEKQLIHLILSHQGALENGSPAVPMTREALILYHADELDSKLNAFEHVWERDGDGDSERRWSRYVPVMDRFFYFGDTRKPIGASRPVRLNTNHETE
ncbi:MAG TPA: HD domain-containing protein [bacterium]|nr:HD domain-containing protein [bacterium]